MSVNQLGWFVHASSLPARQRIIDAQRKPRAFVVPRYQPIQSAVQKYLLSAATETAHLAQAVQRLRAPAASSTLWKQARSTNCLAALQRMQQVATLIDFGQRRIATTNHGGNIVISGLSVSVRPDVFVVNEKAKEMEVGAVKLYFSKDKPLTGEVGATIAIALELFVRDHFAEVSISRPLVQVVDVFAGRVFTPPKQQAEHRRAIKAACREILEHWDDPPSNAA